MSKKSKKSTSIGFEVLSQEELQKLTPEQQTEYFNKLQAAHADLAKKASDLEVENASLKAESKQEELPSFEVEADDENDVEGGTYQFTAPTFTWDDGSVINVRELVEGAESADKKVAAKAQEILAALVARKSGLIRKEEA